MMVHSFQAVDYRMLKQEHDALSRWTSDGIESILHRMEVNETFYTVWDGDEPIAILGYTEIHEGVCEVIFIGGIGWQRRRLFICRLFRRAVRDLTHLHRRVQMMCVNEPAYYRLAEFLGFSEEGILRKYNKAGQDLKMYSIVR
jgi:hypothetical protein